MALSLDNLLSVMQDAVRAVNGLRTQMSTTFPQATLVSTATRGSVGVVTFDSSQATGFLAVTTSSGFTGWVPIYPSS